MAACWRPYFGRREWPTAVADAAGKGHGAPKTQPEPTAPPFFDDPSFPANATSLFNFDQVSGAASAFS